jgi:YD repeat-containing protein
MRQRQSRADFDSPWKEALDYFLEPFLALFFPLVHAGINWTKGYESLDKELHQIVRAARSRKGLADKLFKVWRSTGEETWLLVHIEVQGEPEDDFPLRMFRYNTRAFDRYNRTVVSLAVLTDERPDWRPHRFEYGDWGATTAIRFLTAKLLDWRGREAELEASANPFVQVVFAHARALATRQDPDGRRRYKIQLVKACTSTAGLLRMCGSSFG